MLTIKKKKAVVKSTARHDADTGSPDVQVALLSKQIDELAKHLKKNPKDFLSPRPSPDGCRPPVSFALSREF